LPSASKGRGLEEGKEEEEEEQQQQQQQQLERMRERISLFHVSSKE